MENLYIKSVKIKNFKSFKETYIEFTKGINVIIGPNGAGKSNIIDAILFALGEKSLSRLRAEKVVDLIGRNANVAKVSIVLQGRENNKTFFIERILRKDGKNKILINGKTTKIKELRNFLAMHNIGNIKNAIIAQGEVQKIIKMKPKERKVYLDDLSKTTIYKIRREEALKELEVVNEKIKEINLILGEKEALLKNLEEEIKRAEEYENLLARKNNIKATLLMKELENIKKVLEKQDLEIKNIEEEKAKVNDKLEEIKQHLENLEKERFEFDKKLVLLKERDNLFKELEEKKAEMMIIEQKIKSMEEKKKFFEEEIKAIDEEIYKLTEKLKEFASVDIKDENYEIQLMAKIDEEIENLEKEIEEKKQDIDNYKKYLDKLDTLKSLYKESEEKFDINEINEKLNALMKREKEINARLIEIDNKLLDLREKHAFIRAKVQSKDNAYLIVEELMKTKKIEGIYGRVIDLISFPSELARAIDAAGGNRLSYVVVSSVDVAKEIIEILKRTKTGRLTFIPLNEMKIKLDKTREDMLINFINYDKMFEPAVFYAFSSTVLANSFQEAKEKARNNERVVTISGELFEKTGVISGGYSEYGIAFSKGIEEITKNIEELKEEKAYLLDELGKIKDEINMLRYQKANIQAKIEEKEKKKEIAKEIEKIESWIKENKEKIKEAEEALPILLKKFEQLREQKKEREKMLKEQIEKEVEKKVKIKVKIEEKINLEMQIARLNEKKASLKGEIDKLSVNIREEADKLLLKKAEIRSLEDNISLKYKELENFIEKIKEIDKKEVEIGKVKYELEKRIANLEKRLKNVEISKASISERKKIIEEELEKIKNFVLLDEDEEKLKNELKVVDEKIANAGNINFAAKDLAEVVKKEAHEIKEKIEKLNEEKSAIMDFISQLDEKRKKAFKEAFEKLNEKFKEMIKHIKGFDGGHLLLKGEDPDNCELHIIIYNNGKPIYIDSLAGGEKTLVSLFFLYSMNAIEPLSFYIFDEADTAFDKVNTIRMMEFLREQSSNTQFIIVSHKDQVISKADTIIGVSRVDNNSKAVIISMNGKDENKEEAQIKQKLN